MAGIKPKTGCLFVDEIPESGLDYELQLPGEYVAGLLTPQFSVSSQAVTANFHLIGGGGNVVVTGRLSGGLRAVCGRCLVEFDFPVKKSFRHVFVEGEDPAKDLAEETLGKGDDLDCTFFTGDDVNLLVLAGEELVLSLPLNPICGSDCKGLCPTCGADRNTVGCNCATAEADPRWAKLRELKMDPNL